MSRQPTVDLISHMVDLDKRITKMEVGGHLRKPALFGYGRNNKWRTLTTFNTSTVSGTLFQTKLQSDVVFFRTIGGGFNTLARKSEIAQVPPLFRPARTQFFVMSGVGFYMQPSGLLMVGSASGGNGPFPKKVDGSFPLA